jgi:ATP-dependent Clp protease ATP-binding subunit ClpB
MNSDKLTQKTIETINNATAMARENDNQYVTPEHLLYALLDADGGLIPTLLGRMGADCDALLSGLDTAIGNLPKVQGAQSVYP